MNNKPQAQVREEDWKYDYKFLKDLTYKVNGSDFGEGLSMEEVESVLLAINYLSSSIPTEVQKEEWISVKDRLPNDREKVLVCKYNRQVKEASFLKKDQWDRLDQFIIGGAYYDITKWITHWMPMPSPPNTASSAPPISHKEDEKGTTG